MNEVQGKRPAYIPPTRGVAKQRFEATLVTYLDGVLEAGWSFWTANSHVSMAIAGIENMPLARWACETLNREALAGEGAR